MQSSFRSLGRFSLSVGILAVVFVGSVSAADDRTGSGVSQVDFAKVMSDIELSDCYGKPIALEHFADRSIVVLAFLGTECPLAKLYGPRLEELQRSYAERGVVVLGVSSNTQDSLTELTAYMARYQIGFPLLKDVGHRLADAVGATRTPEVFVLDAERQLRYHGRIDDQYGVGVSRPQPVRQDLKIAIDQLLAGQVVSEPKTKAVGCIIGRSKHSPASAGSETPSAAAVTYNRDIAPILNAHCVECHRAGEIGPFPLTSYEAVLGWEETILEVIGDKRMPPWNANSEYGHFKNDPRLSDQELALLKAWVADGLSEGDPADLPEPPQFVEGWKIGQPDQVIPMAETAFEVPAQGIIDYQRMVVDPGWSEDKYIVAAEARPENRQVVHHILVFVIPPGERRADLRSVVVGYAPGSLPMQADPGTALFVPAGSKLLFEMHYTPNGTAQSDRSYIGVKFSDPSQVKKHLQGQIAIENNFAIPPGESAYTVTAKSKVKQDELLLSMTPHMHLRGKAFRYEARYPDGQQEILLDVPNYDFNWQLKYILSEPKRLPKGTVVTCTAVYDNSEGNLANPDPSRTVGWGDQSWDEMMIGFFDTLPAD